MKLTGAAVLVSRGVKALQAARQLILIVRYHVVIEERETVQVSIRLEALKP